MELPESIKKKIGQEIGEKDQIGMSDSSILIFHDKVLKIQDDNEEAKNEWRMLQWLQNRLPVPKVFAYEVREGKSWLLMERCDGKMACDSYYMEHPSEQIHLLAQGIVNLWNVDIKSCPSNQRLKKKLESARFNVEHGLVDMDNVEPTTFGKGGFLNPQALLQWLYDNQPEEELVLSHGDFCLPNLFFHQNRVSGYIDLGKTGIADKWCDIALCYRSLSQNYSGKYHNRDYGKFDDRLLFQKLGIQPDWDKIRYYILLDELF